MCQLVLTGVNRCRSETFFDVIDDRFVTPNINVWQDFCDQTVTSEPVTGATCNTSPPDLARQVPCRAARLDVDELTLTLPASNGTHGSGSTLNSRGDQRRSDELRDGTAQARIPRASLRHHDKLCRAPMSGST